MATPQRKPPLALIVLAAGKGTRFAGKAPKVLVPCLGLPLLDHVRRAAAPLKAEKTLVVVGHEKERVAEWVEKHWPGATTVVQEPQNGTGHAVRLALEAIPAFDGDVVVLCGDVPQVEAADLSGLLAAHRAGAAAATFLTGTTHDPGRLGRVERDGAGHFARVVEARDAPPCVLAIKEFNTGVYVFRTAPLREAVVGLSRANAAKEEYVTDALARIVASGGTVLAVPARDGEALLGVNTPEDLARAHAHLSRRLVALHMAAGVLVADPASVVIEPDVRIAPGARILPFTLVGHGCRIGPDCVVGPFAHLRGGTVLEAGAQIGNFVEVKASRVGKGAKAKHLTYLGDAAVGENANVGCGTITANYDGKNKHRTKIGPAARIGSGTVLVAPVAVGRGAVTGANAVVLARKNVPAGATVVGVPARVLVKDAGKGSLPAPKPKPRAKAKSKKAKAGKARGRTA